MANLVWLQKVVNTQGLLCPLKQVACPGHRAPAGGCAFWLDEVVTSESGATEALAGCLYVWQYAMGHEIVAECQRTQVAVGQASTTLRDTVKAIGGLAVRAALTAKGAPA